MTIVSIDFSILYPGICICEDFKKFEWGAVINTHISKKLKKNLEDISIEYPSLHFFYTSSNRIKDPLYHITERTKLDNYLDNISLVMKYIKSKVKDTKDLLVVIEGISFGSKGNALVDISQATGILKKELLSELLDGDSDRMFIFSPGTLKNAIGCKGNAGKEDIFDKFKSDPLLESVKRSDLHKAVVNEEWFKNAKGNIVSPIMDMIDSYLGITKIHEILNEKN